ncbi:UNVERIFIED_ORG: HK97 gp10 family phage protein [Rhizobium esperanzae]
MVQGIGDLNKKVALIPKRIELAARGAMEKGADELVAMMKRLVPKDSGDLRDSIGWTWGNAPKGSKVIAQSDPNERGLRITVYAGSEKAYYAAWVEFGTAPHNVAKGGGNKSHKGATNGHPGAHAQPFFFPSYRSLRKRIQDRIKRQTRAAMRLQGPPTAAEAD